jgi:Zn-dependent metalloprotease
LFGVKNQSQELSVMREVVRDGQRSHVRFQQTYQGIPVLGGELIVNMDAAKSVLSMSGEILPDVSLDIVPAIDAAEAQQAAIAAVAKEYGVEAETLTASEPELWIYNPVLLVPWSGPTVLTWRIEVTPLELAPIRQLVLVDASRGAIALSFNQLDTAKNRETYTTSNSTTLPGTLICNESNPACAGGDSHAVAAHKYSGHTYDFYFNYHGRDSINNAGMTLRSTTHFSSGYCNAFWNGSQMVYGDGCNLVVDDVVAHEITHGVTGYESGLFYYYQSGAINESFSDIWGEFVDLTNGDGNDTAGVRWLMGEDSSVGAIRNMANPPAFGDPDRIGSANYYTGTDDNGGVHWNSGVGNKAAYLMTDGGTFNSYTITGLGITKVAKIYYEVQANMLTSGSDYYDLGLGLVRACWNLIGVSGITSSDCNQVVNTLSAVEMFSQPYTGYNPDAQVCPAGSAPADVFNDTFESGFGNWTLGAISGTSAWATNDPWGPNPHSGAKALYADDWYINSNSFARMTNAVLIPANAYLHFYHYFDLESGWDGGVVEYSTNGTTWTDAGGMIDSGKSYNFTGPSRGYVSTRLNLSSLSGQNVRFRWRLQTDGSYYASGWWLDDVRIYNCQTLGAFAKTSPAHVAVNQSLSPTLSWAASTGATSYEYCYSSAAGPCTKWNSVGSNTSVTLSGLAPNYTYYWQVRAVKNGGPAEADSGYWYKFTTVSTSACTWPSYTPPATATFGDVPTTVGHWSWVERLANSTITAGCGGGNYCPFSEVVRAQMAIFLLRGKHCGSSYTPPAVGASTGFGDVPLDASYAPWVKQLAAEGVTAGCGGGNFCPLTVVNRAQMAIFLLRAKHGSTYSPPGVINGTGFNDVPTDASYAPWVKQMAADGITAGCGGGNFCPLQNVNRAQMATFLVRAFGLP